ncbi:MAG TPA: Hsp20/alpha crystallin family protein [Usitatibacter sp.]|nr:Hsp20/alpha crystallin family protein [Usitatibacter sp.]
MDTNQTVLEREGHAAAAEAPALLPPVDIVEDENGITLKADLPGVSREGLSIRVDGDTLTVEGAVALGESKDMQAVYAEVRVARYRRSFVLARDLDTEAIDAAMKNGVLTLCVPKREQAKPRRIEVKAG